MFFRVDIIYADKKGEKSTSVNKLSSDELNRLARISSELCEKSTKEIHSNLLKDDITFMSNLVNGEIYSVINIFVSDWQEPIDLLK